MSVPELPRLPLPLPMPRPRPRPLLRSVNNNQTHQHHRSPRGALRSRMSHVSKCVSQGLGVGIALLHQADKGEEVDSLSQRPGRCLHCINRLPRPALSVGREGQMSKLHGGALQKLC